MVVTDRTKQQLSEMQERLNSGSLTETIKRSIELMNVVSEAASKGETVILRSKDGEETKLQLLF